MLINVRKKYIEAYYVAKTKFKKPNPSALHPPYSFGTCWKLIRFLYVNFHKTIKEKGKINLNLNLYCKAKCFT